MASTHSGLDEFTFPDCSRLVLPDESREELRVELEPVIPEDDLAHAVRNSDIIVTVGDLVSLTAISHGIHPNVCVVDYKTKRSALDKNVKDAVCKIGKRCIKVTNPAGIITRELWDAICVAMQSTEKTRIEIDGEEDLAALVALSIAKDGTAVIYGLPDRGVEVVHSSEKSRKWANDILRKMKVEWNRF